MKQIAFVVTCPNCHIMQGFDDAEKIPVPRLCTNCGKTDQHPRWIRVELTILSSGTR